MIFALALVPMTLVVGLAIDYSFLVAARAQINLAADAAALHAVRVAAQSFSRGNVSVPGTNCGGGTKAAVATPAAATACSQQAGVLAGQQWFAAQLGSLANATVSPQDVVVDVAYTAAPSSFTATVSYVGAMPTHFGKLFDVASLPIRGIASSTISNSYVEVVMLLDNSASMLLGATTADIIQLETATPCSKQSATAEQGMGFYSWNATTGMCDPRYVGYLGDTSACFSPSTRISAISNNACTNGGGLNSTPQAPCAFACHWDASNNDYLGLARGLNPPVKLRLDVVQDAAASVVSTMKATRQTPGQFSVGLYQFNSALQKVFPTNGAAEASTDLDAAYATASDLKNHPQLTPVGVVAQTNFSGAATVLAGQLTASGTGTSPDSPQKNLFIVTDGVNDTLVGGVRKMSAMTSPGNETTCQQFKNLGYAVYVLFTPYLPVPNPFYLDNDRGLAEPTANSPILQALQACASKPSYFFPASSPADIQAAMQAMLRSALNSPGRVAR